MPTSLKTLVAAGIFAVALLSVPIAGAQQAAPAAAPAQDAGPQVGQMAPDFTLPAATIAGPSATPIRLSDLRGKTVVIAFYPRARTRGCTVQMEAYRDQYATLFKGGDGVVVLAVSTDEVQTVADWAKEQGSPLTFVSDTAMVAGALYAAKRPVGTYLQRVLFVIGPDGRIQHIMRPFRELSADSYTELGEAVKKASGG